MNPEHITPQILLRSWPFPRGAGRLLDRFFSGLSFSQDRATVRTTDNFSMTIAPNELIGRHIYLTGEFDRSIFELVADFSETGDVLLDIGANVGYISACFLNSVPDSRVVAVEPQPEVLSLLTENLQRFGRSSIYPFAISDRDGEVWFERDPANLGAGKIVNAQTTNTMRIEVKSADSLFNDMNIERLDIVKIDAEGAEADILLSCAEHFKALQPKVVIFEDNNKSVAPDDALGVTLRQAGYAIYGVRKTLRRLHLKSVNSDNAGHFHDYVAISRYRGKPQRAKEKYGVR